MRRLVRNKSLVGLAVCTLGVLGAGCNGDRDDDGTGAGATSSTSSASTTTAPPPPQAVAVRYTRSFTSHDREVKAPPPERFQGEISLDGASFRMTADDGLRDFAYDARTGQAYEWRKDQVGVPESVVLTEGLASGGPDHRGVSDGPDLGLAALVRTLGRSGDARVTTTTGHGRPAWHYDGPMVGDAFGSTPVEDHLVADVDQESGVLLLMVMSGDGKETRRFEATAIEPRSSDDRSRYRPDLPASAAITTDDRGFRAMTLDEVADTAGYDVLVPGSVPAGFELDEVLFNAEKPLRTGAEAQNPAPARVTSLRWRGAAGTSFTVTLRPESGGQNGQQDGAVWSDPFGSEGTELPGRKISLPLEGRDPLAGELFVAAPAVPHLWGITGNLVVTVDGDLDPAGLESVAASLRKHPRPAPDSAAPVKCPPVGFTPNSDDVASDITARGADCTEASGLVRRAREQHDPVTGPRFFRLAPYACRAVRQDTALESTAYRCEDGGRRVTWEKT